MYNLGRRFGVQSPLPPKVLANTFCRTLATFEECPLVGTSFTTHYTVFQAYLQCGKLL